MAGRKEGMSGEDVNGPLENAGEQESVVEGVFEAIAEVTGRRLTDPDADLADIGLDSLHALDLLAALEERFGIALTEDLTRELRTVSAVVRVVLGTMRSRPPLAVTAGRRR